MVTALRDFERKATLLGLKKSGWVVDPDQTEEIRACRAVAKADPWPYVSYQGLPRAQREALSLGAVINPEVLRRETGLTLASRAVATEEVFFRPAVQTWLASTGSYGVAVGRTHADYSPGISIIGPKGLDPLEFIASDLVYAVHRGLDAERAWSYGRVEGETW